VIRCARGRGGEHGGTARVLRCRRAAPGALGGWRPAGAAERDRRRRAIPARAGRGATPVGPGQGRRRALRPGAGVQGPGPSDALRALGRADRTSSRTGSPSCVSSARRCTRRCRTRPRCGCSGSSSFGRVPSSGCSPASRPTCARTAGSPWAGRSSMRQWCRPARPGSRPRRRRRYGRARRETIAIVVPVFGYKSHLGIDRAHGLIRTWTVTHAAAHDGGQFGALPDPADTASGAWATPPTARPPTWTCWPVVAASVTCSGRSRGADRCRGTRQRQARRGPRRGRARVRGPEAAARAGDPNGRDRPRPGQDRPRQLGLQPDPLRLARSPSRARLTASPSCGGSESGRRVHQSRRASARRITTVRSRGRAPADSPTADRFFEASERCSGAPEGESGAARLFRCLDLACQKVRPVHPEIDPKARERFTTAFLG
jgi:hypothetical protein